MSDMEYNIRRNTHTKMHITRWPTGDRPEETYVRAREEVSVYGTEDVLAYLIKLLKDHNVCFIDIFQGRAPRSLN